MKIMLAENIRAFRKERKLTQEQLSEALGVTVGAVSKWESALSTPDLSLIVDMADYFNTSVDVLLGYGWQNGSMGKSAAKIKSLRNEKKFDEAETEFEKAMQQYPNSFDLVFQGAVLYSMDGVERHGKKAMNRALVLFDRALELIGQNTNPQINEWTIRNSIADVYLIMEQTDKALELMKKNNADGLNDGAIGFTLAMSKKDPDEALKYLSDSITTYVTNMYRVVVGFSNAYIQKHEDGSALDILLWIFTVADGLRRPSSPSYYDKICAQMMTGCALITAQMNDRHRTKEYLTRAKALAEAFDRAPDNGFTNSRFYHGSTTATAFDDFGSSALIGIRKMIVDDSKIPEFVLKMWDEEICGGKS